MDGRAGLDAPGAAAGFAFSSSPHPVRTAAASAAVAAPRITFRFMSPAPFFPHRCACCPALLTVLLYVLLYVLLLVLRGTRRHPSRAASQDFVSKPLIPGCAPPISRRPPGRDPLIAHRRPPTPARRLLWTTIHPPAQE
ncbi:hypothetical protein GCM10010331_30850 [Streptomyces xanthochromogenes]|nr:hypothetical protein GCM10010331_30850 [Streptomyces xanthochromogenes]